MNVHFLKVGSLKLLKMGYNHIMPDLYVTTKIRRSWKNNCDVLGIPKNLEYPKNFIEVISSNEVYKGNITTSRPELFKSEDRIIIFKYSHIGKFLYDLRIIYNDNGRVAITNVEDTVADQLLNAKVYNIFTQGRGYYGYEWDYILPFEKNYAKIIEEYI